MICTHYALNNSTNLWRCFGASVNPGGQSIVQYFGHYEASVLLYSGASCPKEQRVIDV
jgi:hypothetical protein